MSSYRIQKLKDLLKIIGETQDSFMDQYAHDSIVPGICMSPNCDNTSDVEPDCTDGWCDECERGTVESGVSLSEI